MSIRTPTSPTSSVASLPTPHGSSTNCSPTSGSRPTPRRGARRPRESAARQATIPDVAIDALPRGDLRVGRFTARRSWPPRSPRIECASAHTIPGAEGPMSTPKPDETIDQLFEEFLADQEARLSPKTFDKYHGIIHLYRSYLESYWPGHSGKESEAITKAKGTYCGTFGAEEIVSGSSEFLGYFMPRK